MSLDFQGLIAEASIALFETNTSYGSHKKVIFFSGQANKALPPLELIGQIFSPSLSGH